MSNFGKKWSELSGDESRAMKEQYGSRSAWQEAKSRSQTRQAQAPAPTPARSAPTEKWSDMSQQGQRDAKEKYGSRSGYQQVKNRAVARPSPNSQALNNEHTPKANDVGSGAKPAPSSGGLRSDGYASVGPDGKVTTVYGDEAKAAKAAWDQQRAQSNSSNASSHTPTAKEVRADSNEAYRQSRIDYMAAKNAAGGGANTFAVDDTEYYQDRMNTKGYYHANEQKNSIIKGLMGTGQKFGSLDIEREMGSSSTHNLDGLFKHYGGIDNYQENHSVGSGNFQSRYGADEYMTGKDAQGVRDQKQAGFGDWLKTEGAAKYGNYDWFQRDLNNYDQTQARAAENKARLQAKYGGR